MNNFTKFLCFVGGADLKILEKCPNDKNKFIAVGIGVLNTAFLSIFTMGYAIQSVVRENEMQIIDGIETFQTLPISLIQWILITCFSIFWGFVIFGIDWGLVSTIHKKEIYDLKSGSYLFLTTLFRIGVAVIISFTVSKPLEVLVFKEYLPVARREMQVDYQEKLNSDIKSQENTASKDLSDAESELIDWGKTKNENYKKDPIVNQLTNEKNNLVSNYEIKKISYQNLNSTSNENQRQAQSDINSVQNQISRIKNNSNSLTSYEINQINNLENSQSNYINSRNYYRNEINTRNKELNKLNSEIQNKQNEIDKRIVVIDADNQKITEQIIDRNKRLTESKNDVSKEVQIVSKKNLQSSYTFRFNNLINNLIAIGYLEKWADDPKADIGEKAIAKKVIFVRWLLMILILVIDIAPIVIKLLIKRGCYENEKDKILDDKIIRDKAHSIAFARIYPQEAETIAKYESKIKEIKAFEIAKDEFNSTVNRMREKSINDIDKMIKSFHKVDNPEIREILEDFQLKLEQQLDNTKNKMFEIYNKFINSIK